MNSKSLKIATPVVVGLVTILFLVLPLMAGFFVTVDAGHVGVLMTMGAVNPNELQPGFHLKQPVIDVVQQIDTRLISFEVKASSASKDLQNVETMISVQHNVNPSMASEAYQKVGDRDAIDRTIVAPAVQESLKAITAKYTAEELVTRRAKVKQLVTDAIRNYIEHTLKEKKLQGAVEVANVAVTDFDFSREFNLSIEAKVKAEQQALQAKNEKLRRITDAEAAAREKELAADAQAYQINKESIARAQAIQREAKALAQNSNLVNLRAIEKWNGELPKFSGGGSVPFLNIDSLEKNHQVAHQSDAMHG